MPLIRDIHERCRAEKRPALSFEFFPPKTPEGERNLLGQTLPALMTLRPDYCSVTYGAGGSTREKTIEVVDRIQREAGLTTMMHLTCVNHTQAELRAVVEEARGRGIENILALRGDPPAGQADWTAAEGGFSYSYQLVQMLKELGGISIGTAGFPEGHIAQHGGKQADWDYLVQKVAAGADFVITQLFFSNADYFAFVEYLRARGVTIPIVPGILPVISATQTQKFATMCGAQMPPALLERIAACAEDDQAVVELGIQYAIEQCTELLQGGAPGVHFYTLNKAHSTTRVVEGLRAAGML